MRVICPIILAVLLTACHHGRTKTGVINPTPAVSTPATFNPTPTVGHLSEPETASLTETYSPADSNGFTDDPQKRRPSESQLWDVFYGYDRAELSEKATHALSEDAKVLASILAELPRAKIVVEGHCDERGSAEYNLALGDDRAKRAADTLRELGVPASNLETVSYGKESPQCTDSDETCWQKNRRAHIVVR